MTFGGRFILNLIHFAGMQGVSANELLAITGYSEEELLNEELRLEADIYNQVIEQAVVRTGDPYFGLHAGEQMNLAAAGLISQITQTSRTVKEAMEYSCEFAMLGCRAIPMKMVKTGKNYRLSFVPDALWHRQSPLATRQTIEGMLSFMLRIFHSLTMQKQFPAAIHFDFERPANPGEYERIFKCPLQFDQDETAMYFKVEDVDQPTLSANYELLRILVHHARQKLLNIEQNHDFHLPVKRSIINMMNPDLPTIDQVASNLNMSVRTLQRKLKDEGHNFKDIIENLRKDFALEYLRDPQLQISDVAYMLHYSDPSAFIRSFKRWTGKTPLEYRNRITSKTEL